MAGCREVHLPETRELGGGDESHGRTDGPFGHVYSKRGDCAGITLFFMEGLGKVCYNDRTTIHIIPCRAP